MIEGRSLHIRAWVHDSSARAIPRPIYFLDTDFDANSPDDRAFTWHLYGGDQRYRLIQEIILGVGGLRILRDLGYDNIKTFHLNEGHAGFLTLELLREMVTKTSRRCAIRWSSPPTHPFPQDTTTSPTNSWTASWTPSSAGGSGACSAKTASP
jgi:glucan phosphorylase